MAKRRRSVQQVERDARAVELRRNNLTYRQIATQLDFSSVASAYEAVQRGLADSVAETNEEVRQMELDRLDHLARTALTVLAKPHLVVSQGRVATHPATGEPLTDPTPALHAIDRLLRIQERRARLLGLDAKTAHDMGVAEQQVKLAEQQALLLAQAIERVLDGLELTGEQRALVPVVVPRELRAIEGGA
jgi:hypothetical protein